ncbi:phosphate ABC transporter permease subunit PstC [Scatolibacter rhodanostii]|uniref:phosphate ABC transporter permease subunit PstC n=1 Tax=Scatolibacter rhodanostii TaxID=2014781 RepID=UPI000C083716|nr:phosphate ABC transporter permease subunit PstC [Scatolibacter rhodanostii]
MKNTGKKKETVMKYVFLVAAAINVLCVALICVFLFANGFPAMAKIGPLKFLLGTEWRPGNDIYGIAPMILGSLYVTAGAILIGVPLGVLTAIFLAKFCPDGLYRFFRPAVSLMAGIPSIIYGFFGLVLLVPITRNVFGTGKSILTASILLGIMILPTVISVSETAIRAVPSSYYEGSLALGSTHEKSVFFAVVPPAKSGILTAVVLGIGRAVGETMAVIMIAGNQAIMPESVVKGVRTLTANIVIEMGYAADLHREALIATAVVLFIMILLINLLLSLVKKEKKA